MAYGSVLAESVDSNDARKARGAFFTPPELARYLAEFAIRDGGDAVLEPSCGEGAFLVAALNRLIELGASKADASSQVHGYELHAATASAARDRLSRIGLSPSVSVGDFFYEEPGPHYDSIVGNPPYIRYQDFAGAQRARARADAQRAGVRLDALASSWAPFLVHATMFLKPGGRLAFVLPAELLTTNYAAPVRSYVLESFPSVTVALFEESVFPEVQEEVVLLLAEGFGEGATNSVVMKQVAKLPDLWRDAGYPVGVEVGGRWPLGQAGEAAKRALGLLLPAEFGPLSEWGLVRLGAVTGNNKFFALSKETAMRWGLGDGDLLPLCPPGSRHLRKTNFTRADLESLGNKGKPIALFSPRGGLGDAAARYVEWGERRHVNDSYKCRVRKPWWRVPGIATCDLFLTYMNGMGPNICANDADAVHLNSIHGVHLVPEYRTLGREVLPTLALSTPTLLSAEICGRSYGGGVLKLEPREATKLLVPTPKSVEKWSDHVMRIREQVNESLEGGDQRVATEIVDRLFVGVGIVDAAQMSEMRSLLEVLRNRRIARGRGLRHG